MAPIATKKKKSKTAAPEAKTKSKKAGGDVMAKLRAEKAKKTKKATGKLKPPTGHKGAEKPAEDEATENHTRQRLEESAGSQTRREEAHFEDTGHRRIVGHASARGRKTQARRDQRG